MANALRTFTIDTASSPWIKQNGEVRTVSGTAEDFQLYLIDLGTTGNYIGAGGGSVTLDDGSKIDFGADKRLIHLGTFEDGTAKTQPGSLWVREDGGQEIEVKVVTATFTDADHTGNDNLAAITFEYPGKPYRWSWANIKMA